MGPTSTTQHESNCECCEERQVIGRRIDFQHRGRLLTVVLPPSADDLIDEVAFAEDERLPYWADLWPSAVALARHVLEWPGPGVGGTGGTGGSGVGALELGCGVGLVSLALAAQGFDVLATDYEPEALRHLLAGAEACGVSSPRTALLDWRRPDPAFSAPLVAAADVLYEERNAASFAAALSVLVAPGGRALIADPGRRWLASFLDRMNRDGWSTQVLEVRREQGTAPGASDCEVRIIELSRPATVDGADGR